MYTIVLMRGIVCTISYQSESAPKSLFQSVKDTVWQTVEGIEALKSKQQIARELKESVKNERGKVELKNEATKQKFTDMRKVIADKEKQIIEGDKQADGADDGYVREWEAKRAVLRKKVDDLSERLTRE